jgi:TonB family protein
VIIRFLLVGAAILCSWLAVEAQGGLEYRSYEGIADGFSVLVPFAMNVRGDAGSNDSRKYYGDGNATWVYVFSEPSKELSSIKTVKRFVESNGQAFATGGDFKHPSTVSFKDSFGYWQKVVAFNSNGRTYVLQAVCAGMLDPIGDRFISSFKFDHAIPAPEYKTKVEPVPDDQIRLTPPTPAGPGIGSASRGGVGSGIGSGQGSGQGNGTGSGAISSLPAPPPAYEKIRILSKPRPAYTDFARVYEINGSVVARVTFKANGEIGAVSVTKSLPFGLTEQAIKAAERMTFVPATVEGTPTTVTKLVEYNFSIY